MKIAVTGAAGFVGRHLVAHLLKQGDQVRAIVRPRHDAQPLARAGAEVARVDLARDSTTSVREVLAGCDAIVHAAARVGWGSVEAFRRDGVEATAQVLEACRLAGVPRLVHVSSTAVYGDRAVERGPVSEDAPYGYRVTPWDRYASSKIAAERHVLEVSSASPAPQVAVIRPGWIIGEGDRSCAALLDGLRRPFFPLIGRGSNRLPLTYVGSVVDACSRAARVALRASRAYNIACDFDVTQRQFLAALARAKSLAPRWVPFPFAFFFAAGFGLEALAQVWPGFDPPLTRNVAVLLGRDARFETSRAREELGWQPQLGFAATIDRIARSFGGRGAAAAPSETAVAIDGG